MGGWRRVAVAAGVGMALGSAWGQGIYTCVDAKGKRLTSDRYIADCSDREQRLLNSNGTLRQLVPPTLTGPERDALEAQEKRKQEELQKKSEDKRVLKALAMRYPTRASHEAERAKALRSIDEASQMAQHNIAELGREKARLLKEAEFYKDPATMPDTLKRQLAENEQQVAAQQRYIANQDEEKKRVNDRFDEDMARLKPIWNPPAAAGVAAAAASGPMKR